MADGYEAFVEVLPDFSKLQSRANSELSGILGSAGTAGGVVAGSNIGGGIVGGIKGFAGPVLAAVAALGIGTAVGNAIGTGIRYSLDSINLASDLEQAVGAVDAVFKGQASVIQGFAATAAKDIGLAKTQYLNFATVVGSQFKNLGVPVDQIAGSTQSLISLGADLAAQFGGDTSDAVSALSSLLRGETDPIERYGISIKQSDITARLAAQGLGDLTGEAEKQARIQATLALLYGQTTDAQGTFAREQDTLAGKQQRLNALLQDAQTEFGQNLLPTAIELTEFATDELLPILSGALDKAGPQLVAALEGVMPQIKELVGTAAENLPAAIEAAVGAASLLADSFSADFGAGNGGPFDPEVWERTNGFFTDYLPRWAEGSVPVQESWDGFFQWWDLAWDGTADTVQNKSDGIKAYWATSLGALKQMTADFSLQSEGYAVAQGFADGIETGAELAALAAERMALAARAKVVGAMQIASPSKVMRELGLYVAEGMALGITDGTPQVSSAVQGMVNPSLVNGLSAAGGRSAVSSAGGGGTTVNMYTNDPYAAGQMVKQELDARLATR